MRGREVFVRERYLCADLTLAPSVSVLRKTVLM